MKQLLFAVDYIDSQQDSIESLMDTDYLMEKFTKFKRARLQICSQKFLEKLYMRRNDKNMNVELPDRNNHLQICLPPPITQAIAVR